MSVERHCPRCKQLLPDGLLEGSCPHCLARVVSASLLPGNYHQRFGDYELLEEIGRGGMGIVYKARQVSLDRVVAIKMMLSAQFASGTALERFHAEAKAIARFEHPNIVAVHEVGTHESQPYFSMQWIDGSSLDRVSAECGVRNGEWLRQSAALMATVARAVHHAHQRGILHRDLKPANILLDAEGEPHVSDFGLARSLSTGSEVTVAGSVLGSPSFMAPEQAAGKTDQPTTSADIYGLGAVLYFLLTGRAPFASATPLETLREVVEQEPVKPSTVNRAVDRDLETICLKCLEKDPQCRYTSADALADDLERWLRHEPIRARAAGTVEQIAKWARRKPGLASSIGAVLLISALGFAAVLWEWRQTDEARRQATHAKQDALEKLYGSYLAQARANRWSGRPGRRFESLDALGKAAAMRPSLELRNEAIACLTLPDVRVERRITTASPTVPGSFSFDAACERYTCKAADGTISIRRIADDRELLSLPGPADAQWASLWLSPNGRYLAERYRGTKTNQFLVWDLSQQRVVFSRFVAARHACFRPGSEECTVAEDGGSIWSYDLGLGREVWRLQFPGPGGLIRYDTSGKRLAVPRSEHPNVLIVNIATGAIEQRLDHPAWGGQAAWSPDGKWLACPGADGRTYLLDVATGSLGDVFEGHIGVVTGAQFNPEGDILVTSSWDGTTRFWDMKLGKPIVSLPGSWLGIPFGVQDKLGFAVSDREAGVWQVDSARECRRFGRTGQVSKGQFSPDGHLLAVAATDGVWIWHVEANRMLWCLEATNSSAVLFLPDGHRLTTCGSYGAKLWSLEYSKALTEFRAGNASILTLTNITSVCAGPNARTLVAGPGDDWGVLLLDLQNPGALRRMGTERMTGGITASPDGRWFATGNWHGTNVMVWEMATCQPVRALVVKGSSAALFSPDGQWLVTGAADEYCLWKVGSWEPGLRIPRDRAGDLAGGMAFSPDGQILAVVRGRRSDVRLIALPSGTELATLDTGPPLCFSEDGSLLATAGEELHTVFVWDLRLIRQRLAAMNLDW
jgi:eukaryotic-like serine/threonine-protein kinase